MQFTKLKNESLIDIATFLARRWSGRENVTIEFTDKMEAKSRLVENKIIVPSISKLFGDEFQRYRQFRTMLWYESMRVSFCKKILSNDHAFGFILNAMETRRIEMLGRKVWRGMDKELIFYYTFLWIYRPQLNSVYGKARIVEAFYQHFLFGAIKGEIQSNDFERVRKASELAHITVNSTLKNNYETDWLESQVRKIIEILDIDSILTIPLALPFLREGMAINDQDLMRLLKGVTKNREGDFGKVDPKAVMKGENVLDEYNVLMEEMKKNENKGLEEEHIGIQIPTEKNVDETLIYDMNLINSLKIKFKDWKTGWKEQHVRHGEEFDEETYLDGNEPFFTDVRKSIKTNIVILLDHSSSIASNSIEYKKATLALCELLGFLKVRFAVYAFSTQNKSVVCWLIKPENSNWNNVYAKRLAQIVANGSTPLAEIYNKMMPTLQAKRPDIFLTLTDGEPSDPFAVQTIIKNLKHIGIRMVAIGLGPDLLRSTTIANNLKHLGYEKTMAVSRLQDIPNKVIGLLRAL